MLSVLPDLASIWSTQLGPRSDAYRELSRRLFAQWGIPEALTAFKREPGHDLKTDAALLAEYLRRFWRLPEFWRRTAPLLLIPGFVVRARGRLPAALTPHTPPLPAQLAGCA